MNQNICNILYSKELINITLKELSKKRVSLGRKNILNKSIRKAVCPFCKNEYIYQYWKYHHLNKCTNLLIE